MKNSGHLTRSVLLDLLRIFAAFWVVSFHWVGRGGFSPGLNNPIDFSFWPHVFTSVASPGFLGVDIFFILSGAVIGKSSINKTWQHFSQNRFLRLFPVYALATVLAIAVVPLADSDWSRFDALASLSGMQFWIGGPTIIGAAWTLAIEIQFYSVVALFILLNKTLSTEKIRQLSFLIIVLSVATSALNFGPVSFFAIAPWGGYFALGMLLSTTTDTAQLRRNSFPILIAMVLSGNSLFNRLSAMYPGASPTYKIGIPLVILIIVTGIILFSSMNIGTLRVRIEWTGIATLSLMTYPIYLFHESLGLSTVSLLSSIRLSPSISFLIIGVFVLLLSWISVRWLEPVSRKLLRVLFGWSKSTY